MECLCVPTGTIISSIYGNAVATNGKIWTKRFDVIKVRVSINDSTETYFTLVEVDLIYKFIIGAKCNLKI